MLVSICCKKALEVVVDYYVCTDCGRPTHGVQHVVDYPKSHYDDEVEAQV
jgi:hypothetical protein